MDKGFQNSIEKKFGKGIISNGEDVIKRDLKTFSISPNFDAALGGVPEGTWVTFSGPSGCGKTTMALEIAGVMQEDGREVFYIDAENRLKKMNLQGIRGLNAEKVHVIRSSPEVQLTGEDLLQIGTDALKAHPGCILIIDSASSLCPANEMVGEVSGSVRTSSPKMLGNFCRKNSSVVNANRNVVFVVKHIINNTSGWGEKLMEDGGVKIQFQADIRVITKGKPEAWKDGTGEDAKIIGHIVEWDVLKSATGASGGSFKSYIRYGIGLDRVMEFVQLGQDYGIITKAGSWLSIGDQKWQGQANLRQYLEENPDKFKELKAKVNEIHGV